MTAKITFFIYTHTFLLLSPKWGEKLIVAQDYNVVRLKHIISSILNQSGFHYIFTIKIKKLIRI